MYVCVRSYVTNYDVIMNINECLKSRLLSTQIEPPFANFWIRHCSEHPNFNKCVQIVFYLICKTWKHKTGVLD